MKKDKIWKVIWIIGIYAILVTVLYLVVLYKVEWEDKDLNTYLYFYDCDNNLCTSSTKQDKYYSRFLCENNSCPYVTNIIKNNLILEKEGKSLIYDYVNGKVINDTYNKYRYLDDEMFVVTDITSNKEGIINLNGEILVDFKYDYIDNFDKELIAFKSNNLFGIDMVSGINKVEVNFEDIVLIDNEKYAGMKNNVYHIYSFIDNQPINSNTYDFISSLNDLIFVINNNKVDILTASLNSTLLIKIDTFYSYKTEKERDSLNLYSDNNYIYFDIYNNEYEITSYKYDINNKKLV